MRIKLDTNVLVSAFMSKTGYSARVLDIALTLDPRWKAQATRRGLDGLGEELLCLYLGLKNAMVHPRLLVDLGVGRSRFVCGVSEFRRDPVLDGVKPASESGREGGPE